MLKRYRMYLYLKERIYMTLREIVTAAHDEFKAVADRGQFMTMSETPIQWMCRGCLIRKRTEMRGLLQEIVSSRHAF